MPSARLHRRGDAPNSYNPVPPFPLPERALHAICNRFFRRERNRLGIPALTSPKNDRCRAAAIRARSEIYVLSEGKYGQAATRTLCDSTPGSTGRISAEKIRIEKWDTDRKSTRLNSSHIP